MFSLLFDPKEIQTWAGRYSLEEDQQVEGIIAPQVRSRGYYTKQDFVATCHWKTRRSKLLVESNPQGFVQAVTQTALSTSDERLRIEVLTLLTGVSWSTASVLLHFGHSDPYPILDFRALWSLSMDVSQISYDFDFWWDYTQYCRNLACETGVTMRVLDRALWQYSYDSQGKTK